MTGLIVLLAIFAVVPSVIAARKGRSAIGFYLFGLLFFLPALIVVLLIPATGDSVEAMYQRQHAGTSRRDDVLAQIEQLHALVQRGALTEDEFEAKKRELLDRM